MFRIYGWDLGDSTAGRSIWQNAHPEDRDWAYKEIERAIDQKTDYNLNHRILLSDGTVKYIHSIAHPVLDAAGDLIEYVGTSVDITERKRTEEEQERLRQLEADLALINRVSMMGELAASLGHEIKQPITGMAINARVCMRRLERQSPEIEGARQAVAKILDNIDRITGIIDRNRTLYMRGTAQRERIDVNEVIGQMVLLLHDTASRHSVSVSSDLDAALPKALADRVQLQQVLMNLMLNGIEAMKDGHGELGVASRRTEDNQLLISVSDSGVGLPAKEPERIFEAFFTTKPQGTGMGLSISRRIIEAHGGRLWANPNRGRGATFQFTLPNEAACSPKAV
jgi:PAS domain S-box-containing protein